MSEPSLEELWQRKADHEHGAPTPEEEALDIFWYLVDLGEKSEDVRRFIPELKQGLSAYAGAVIKHNQLRDVVEGRSATAEELQAIEGADKNRTRVHDALISTLNAIMRACVKGKLDTKWKDVVGLHPLDRTVVGRWALAVARAIAG